MVFTSKDGDFHGRTGSFRDGNHLFCLYKSFPLTEVSHHMCSSALVQMCARLAPNQDWFELPRDFILRLGRLANDQVFGGLDWSKSMKRVTRTAFLVGFL